LAKPIFSEKSFSEKKGWDVIRFSDEDVEFDAEAVVIGIANGEYECAKQEKEATPSPALRGRPSRGEGVVVMTNCGGIAIGLHTNTLPLGGSASQGRGGPKHG
jgi:hypothetical protein